MPDLHAIGEPAALDARPRQRIAYLAATAAVSADILALVRFGTASKPPHDALCIDVALEPLAQSDVSECWLATGPVTRGASGSIRYAFDDESLFGVIDVDERDYRDISAASEAAYREIAAFQRHSDHPSLLRMWNTMDAINEHAGDLERYRQFCLGRARAWSAVPAGEYPAASCIGRQHRTRRLQVYWLASRTPAHTVENPRQTSAYHYPREHGPASPSFSRASITRDGVMFISGTASIVGHASLHLEDPIAQAEETLRNLQTLQRRAPLRIHRAAASAPLMKVYVRDPAHLHAVQSKLHDFTGAGNAIYLAADICRRELLLEVEGVLP